nr:hypothetical protein [Gammaproteobacteria bacterium]
TSPTASFAAKVFHQEEVKALEDFFKQEASSFSAVQSDGEVVCARRKAKGAENTLQGGSNNQLGIFKPPAPAEVKQDAAPSSPSTVALGRKCG